MSPPALSSSSSSPSLSPSSSSSSPRRRPFSLQRPGSLFLFLVVVIQLAATTTTAAAATQQQNGTQLAICGKACNTAKACAQCSGTVNCLCQSSCLCSMQMCISCCLASSATAVDEPGFCIDTLGVAQGNLNTCATIISAAPNAQCFVYQNTEWMPNQPFPSAVESYAEAVGTPTGVVLMQSATGNAAAASALRWRRGGSGKGFMGGERTGLAVAALAVVGGIMLLV